MPVSAKRIPQQSTIKLRTPQARVLAALQPDHPDDHLIDWPLLPRPQLGVRAGYTAISGTVTRALNGIRPGSSSGDSHLGLIDLKLVDEITLVIEGLSETNYRATTAGVAAYNQYLADKGGKLPQLRDAAVCTNDRYKQEDTSA